MMNLLVLDFSDQSHESLRGHFAGRSWNALWPASLDRESILARLKVQDIQQVLWISNSKPGETELLQDLQKGFPQVSLIFVSNEPHSHFPDLNWLPLDGDMHALLRAIEEGFQYQKRHQSFCKTWIKSQDKASVDPRFFKSLDLFHVIDRMFTYFCHRLLSEDIHWVRKSDLEGFLTEDLSSLRLELEVDYKKSHRLRSLNEQNPMEVIEWLRELPLKKLDLTQPGKILHQFGTHLWLPIKDQGEVLGYFIFQGVEGAELESLLEQLEESLQMMSRFLNFAIQLWEAQNMTLMDDLTDLHNQRYLPRVLDREMARAKRIGKKFTVMFMDVDYFKKVNDSNGHWVGSHLLVELGKLLKASVRTCDYAFRYGGDEFVLVLVDSDGESSKVVAERIRKRIEETRFEVAGQSLKVTVSIGLACYPDHAQSRQEIIELADQAMYYGKNKSRNIVYVAS